MRRPRGQKTRPSVIAARERAAKALELRKQGYTFREIAATAGYRTLAAAYDAVQRAMRDITAEPAEQLRALETSRLDRMLARIWPKVEAGELPAIDRALKICERRCRLMGLDAKPEPQVNAEIPPLRVNIVFPGLPGGRTGTLPAVQGALPETPGGGGSVGAPADGHTGAIEPPCCGSSLDDQQH